MRSLVNDLRWALRSLRAAGGTTVFAVATLAIGIGGTAAVFSLVNAVLLRALPYRDADRLVAVWQHVRPLGLSRVPLSLPELVDYTEQARTIQGIAALQSQRLTYQGEFPELWDAARVSTNLLPVLGIEVRLGRGLVPGENTPGRTQVAILSDALWKRRFGADPTAVGRSIVLNGAPHTVVGVLPQGIRLPGVPEAELLVPSSHRPEDLTRRNTRSFRAIARLSAGVSREQAQQELRSLAARGATIAGLGVDLVPLREELLGDVRRPLILSLAAVAFVLLIACANVANFSLARLSSRGRELAVRSALGASRATLMRQLVTESVLLAIVAGAVGLMLAFAAQDMLVRLSPADFPRVDETRIDVRVGWFTAALSLVAGMGFGLVAAWQASTGNVIDALKEEGPTATGGLHRRSLRRLIVAGEVALALVLLVCAGLVVRSFLRLLGEDTGFDHTRVVAAAIDLPESRYPDRARREGFFRALLEQVRGLPGIEIGAITSALPMTGSNADFGFVIPERPLPSESDFFSADWRVVSEDYFRAVAVPLRSGRYLQATDRGDAPPVVVINEAMAKAFWATEDPVGKHIKLGLRSSPLPTLTIVGVVGNVRHAGLHQSPRPEMFVAYAQTPEMPSVFRFPPMTLVVRHRAGIDPGSVVRSVRSVVRGLDPQQAVGATSTMAELVATSLASRRFSVRLFVLFAGLALVMAAIGVYGVVSSWVHLRVREIGIRMALGADRRTVLNLILGDGLRLSAMGAAVGLVGAAIAARMMGNLLYGISTADPLTFTVAAMLTMAVALCASGAPAWQAATVDPLSALRLDQRSFPVVMRQRAGLLRTRAWDAIGHALNRSAVESTRLISAMAASARSAQSLEEHAAHLAETLRSELQIECLTIFVGDERSRAFVAVARQPPLANDAPLMLAADGFVIRRLRRLSTALATDEEELTAWLDGVVDAPPEVQETRQRECSTLRTSGTSWLFPLWVKGELVGALGLGPRSDRTPLSSRDRVLLSSLAGQIAFIVQNASLARRVAEHDRLRREVEIAASVQQRLFPQQPPRLPGFAITGVCRPAREVGGDYYDYFESPAGQMIVAVADVAGKGLGPALVMSSVQAALRTLSAASCSPAETAAQINRLLLETTAGNSYATLFCAQLEPATRRLRYVNAGHCAPIVCRQTPGEVQTIHLHTGGPVVGLLPQAVYEEGVVDLQAGDLLFIYTDGLTEAMNDREEEFGEERLEAAVTALCRFDVEAIIAGVLEDLQVWRGTAAQHDDQTLVVMRVAVCSSR